VFMNVPLQILCSFVFKHKNIYAEKRLKPPIARKDQIRLFVLEKSLKLYNYERKAT